MKFVILAFALVSLPLLAREGGRENYCRIVDFDAGLVVPDLLTSSKHVDKCDSWRHDKKAHVLLMPVRMDDATGEPSQFIYLSHAASTATESLPPFIKFHKKTKKYAIDYARLNFLLDSPSRYQLAAQRMLAEGGSVTTKLDCKVARQQHGGYTTCRVFHENEDLKRSWIEGYYYYYNLRPGLSALYWSPLISTNSPEDMHFLDRMDNIFGSMRVYKD